MTNKIPYIQVLGLCLVVSACSGNGNRVQGNQCPKRYDPVAMNIPAQSKLDIGSTVIPNGTYQLVKSELFFRGTPTELAPDGFQVLLRQEASGLKTKVINNEVQHGVDLKSSAECFRNAKVTQEHGIEVPGVTGLLVVDGQVRTTDVKPFGFTMSAEGQFEMVTGKIVQQRVKPQDVLRDADETFVVKHSPNDYEFRTKGPGTNGSYYLSTFLHRVK